MALVALTGLAVALNGEERRGSPTSCAAPSGGRRDQSALLATILESMTDGVFVVDADGGTVLQNPAALRFFGLARPITSTR